MKAAGAGHEHFDDILHVPSTAVLWPKLKEACGVELWWWKKVAHESVSALLQLHLLLCEIHSNTNVCTRGRILNIIYLHHNCAHRPHCANGCQMHSARQGACKPASKSLQSEKTR